MTYIFFQKTLDNMAILVYNIDSRKNPQTIFKREVRNHENNVKRKKIYTNRQG